jgi:flavodoxin
MKKSILALCILIVSGLGGFMIAQTKTSTNTKALVVYYSLPEPAGREKENSSVDKNGKTMGNNEYVASVIASELNAAQFRIDTVQKYPINNHQTLIDQAKKEQRENYRPELVGNIENLNQYDVIFLGYPNWWGDLPMALYTFFEQNDLSGKKIIPFCTHGGSGLSGTVNTIAKLQPKATVEKNALSIYRTNVEESEATIKSWLRKLGY